MPRPVWVRFRVWGRGLVTAAISFPRPLLGLFSTTPSWAARLVLTQDLSGLRRAGNDKKDNVVPKGVDSWGLGE